MSRDNQVHEWARRLEEGDRSEPELELAAQLRQSSLPRPAAPAAFKQELRGRLLQRYESPGWRFGRMASSLAAIAVLVAAVALFRLWMMGVSQTPFGSPAVSSQSTATPTPPPSATDVDAAIPSPTPIGQPPELGVQLVPTIVPIPLLNYSLASDLVQRGSTVEVVLDWEAAALASQPLNLFLHLTTADGVIIVAQLDRPVAADSTAYSLTVPPETEPGEYLLLTGLYPPDNAANRLLLQSADRVDTVLEIGRITVLPDRVWIVSVSPEAGTAVAQTTVFEVEIGYELVSTAEAQVKLHLAHPDWQSMAGGQLPIEGMSEWLPITAGEGTLNVRYEVADSNYLATILGDRAVLYVQVATVEEGGRLNILLEEMFSDYEWAVAEE